MRINSIRAYNPRNYQKTVKNKPQNNTSTNSNPINLNNMPSFQMRRIPWPQCEYDRIGTDANDFARCFPGMKVDLKRELIEKHIARGEFEDFIYGNFVIAAMYFHGQNEPSNEAVKCVNNMEYAVRNHRVNNLNMFFEYAPSQNFKDKLAQDIFNEFYTYINREYDFYHVAEYEAYFANGNTRPGVRPGIGVLLPAIKNASPKVQKNFKLTDVMTAVMVSNCYGENEEEEIDAFEQIADALSEDTAAEILNEQWATLPLYKNSWILLRPILRKARRSDKLEPRIKEQLLDMYCATGGLFSKMEEEYRLPTHYYKYGEFSIYIPVEGEHLTHVRRKQKMRQGYEYSKT